MISVLRAEKITAGLIASPLAPYPQENFCLPVFEKRLHSWYVRHGFRQAKKLPSVLIYDANVPQQGIEMLL